MWIPPAMEPSNWWIWALETWVVWQLQIKTKEFDIAKIRVEENVDLGSEIKDYLLPNVMFYGGTLLSLNIVV